MCIRDRTYQQTAVTDTTFDEENLQDVASYTAMVASCDSGIEPSIYFTHEGTIGLGLLDSGASIAMGGVDLF